MVVHVVPLERVVPVKLHFGIITKAKTPVVQVLPGGVPDTRLAALARLPGVTDTLPILNENPTLLGLPTGGKEEGSFFSSDVMFLGCDLAHFLAPKTGMIHGEFVGSNLAVARSLLARGDTCVISDNLFRRFPQLYDLGRTITLDSGAPEHRTLTYTIAGIVKVDGWQLFMRYVGMRRNEGRIGGMIFVPPVTARRAYPESAYHTLWFKLAPGARAADLEAPRRRARTGRGAAGESERRH